MKEHLNSLLSEVGESFDYLGSDIRNLGRYLAELEGLIESYRTFAVTLTLSTSDERAALRELLKKTLKVVGPPLGQQQDALSQDTARTAPGTETLAGAPIVVFFPEEK